MKEKIVILASFMNLGGLEKALLGQLSQYNENEHDVTVLFLEKVGVLLREIPSWIKVDEVPKYRDFKDIVEQPLHHLSWRYLKKGKLLLAIKLLLIYINVKLVRSYAPVYQYLTERFIEPYPGHFDLAISYMEPSLFNAFYVINKIDAEQKWAWIHFDVSKLNIGGELVNKMRDIYPSFDRINIVSQEACDHFNDSFPKLKGKTHVCYSVINENAILESAENAHNPYDGIKTNCIITTVARMTAEKGHRLAIDALNKLVKKGYDVTWCFVGTGKCFNDIAAQVKEYGLEKNVLFVGEQLNPYPYMKYCTIYVQPSLHEGFCLTLAEAKLFNVPIVCTPFAGAKEQLRKYDNSIIINDVDAQNVADGIEQMINKLGI